MKSLKLLTVLMLLMMVSKAQVKFSALTPEAGKAISFTYDPKGTKLEKSADITCQVFSFFSGAPKITKVNLIKEGGLYKAEVPTTDSTTLVALSFSMEDVRDDNPAGYYVKLSKGGKIPAEAYSNEASLLDTYGRSLYMKPDLEKSVAAYDQAFILKPALKDKYLFSYLSLNYRLNKETGSKLAIENIDRLTKANAVLEKDLTLIYNLYSLLKDKAAADAAKNAVLKAYPKGPFAYNQEFWVVLGQKNAAAFEEKMNSLIASYNLDQHKKADADKLNYLYSILARGYAKEKNNEKFDFYAGKISDKVARAGIYNSIAWPWAEKNENTAFATEISKKSLEAITLAKDDEVPASYSSKEEYLKNLESTYGMYADTYALLLYNSGKYKEAIAYQDKSFSILKTGTADMRIRYVTYLKKDGQFEKAFTEAERVITEGNATDSIRNDFKMLYAKLGKKGDYKTHLSKIEALAYSNERAVWLKKMIDMPAPTFTLANLKGEKVSLSDFKGKTVVIDYWATWCGPCIASFPGMQLAINKYKDNPNVVFLFINTLQREENREKTVNEFMDNNKKYTFNVLLDTKSKADPNEFDVVRQYKVEGIPTKFIIDGKGNIRFKMVGFSGSAEGVVKELDMMLGLAAGNNELAKAK